LFPEDSKPLYNKYFSAVILANMQTLVWSVLF